MTLGIKNGGNILAPIPLNQNGASDCSINGNDIQFITVTNPAAGIISSDVAIALPRPATSIFLASWAQIAPGAIVPKPALPGIYIHLTPLRKITDVAFSDGIPMDGSEQWIDFNYSYGTYQPFIKFAQPFDRIYMTVGTNVAGKQLQFSFGFTCDVVEVKS